MQTTLSDNGGGSCKYTPWGRLAHLGSSSDQTGDRNGLPTVWEPEDTITDVVGATPGCQGCHFTLVGLLSPKTLSSEGSTKYEFSSKSSTFLR